MSDLASDKILSPEPDAAKPVEAPRSEADGPDMVRKFELTLPQESLEEAKNESSSEH